MRFTISTLGVYFESYGEGRIRFSRQNLFELVIRRIYYSARSGLVGINGNLHL